MDFDEICVFIFNSNIMWLVSIICFSMISFAILLLSRVGSKIKFMLSVIIIVFGIIFGILCYQMMMYLQSQGMFRIDNRPGFLWEMIRPFYPGLILSAIIISIFTKLPHR